MDALVRLKACLAAVENEEGQAAVESAVLYSALLVGASSLMFFLPDMLAAITIYLNGFYLILGYPIG